MHIPNNEFQNTIVCLDIETYSFLTFVYFRSFWHVLFFYLLKFISQEGLFSKPSIVSISSLFSYQLIIFWTVHQPVVHTAQLII